MGVRRLTPGNLSPAKRALLEIRELRAQLDAARSERNAPVAIVGMGCRYPGASDIGEFWDMLVNGRDAIGEVPRSRWDVEAVYDPDPAAPGKMASRQGGFVAPLEEFDAAFFGITPREAPYVDPRQRLMLEIAWEALEDAGIPPGSLAGSQTGVFIATLTSDYSDMVMGDLRRAEAYSGPGTANCVVANRISYFLDLRGPSISLDTACSGSLVALHMACESLRGGECSLALAGGVSLNLLARSNVFFTKAGALSPDGRCHTFDERANGIVRSDGAGIVALKLLPEALAAGDPVVAVIRASALNHDGRSNGIMAPNGEAQKAVLREAYRRAGISPAQVQYVQAHGTGTRLGDPIEVRALGEVLAPGRAAGEKCVLGSVKTNIGHSESAAGVAGVIAVSLAMRHGVLPPTVHFTRPNPLIPFGELPFEVRPQAGGWPQEQARRIAGVSGFGFGGSNAHVVLEAAPADRPEPPCNEPPYLLPVSARSPEALRALAARYRDRLGADPTAPGAICYTAAARRSHHGFRLAVTGASAGDLGRNLDGRLTGAAGALNQPDDGRLAFVFSGQGSHWPGMGCGAYPRFPVFREALEQASRLFAARAGWSLVEELGKGESESRLRDTGFAQPAIFAVQVALAALWRSWGIVPDVVVGHSLGEAAAAVAAGALSLEDGVRVVFERSRLMKTVAGKGMTAVVGLPLDRAAEAIRGRENRLSVAGSNGPANSVLSGDPETLGGVLRALEGKGVFCRAVAGVDIAFHSPQMDPLKEELIAALAGLAPRTATIPMVSTVTGQAIEGASLGAAYWGRNLREPFLFTQAMARILGEGCAAALEVAPHPVLSSAILQGARQAGARLRVLPSLRRNENEIATLYGSLGALYELGREVNWRGVYPAGGPVMSLPHYPWQRERYWIDQLPGGGREEQAAGTCASHPLLGPMAEPAIGGGARMCVWEMDLSPNHPGYLADHRVMGEVILPASACLEMALAAFREAPGGGAAAAVEVVFERPLGLAESEPTRVQLAITVRAGESEFALYSRAGEWQRAAYGKLAGPALGERPTGPRPTEGDEDAARAGKWADLAAIRGRCAEAVAVDAHYQALSAAGLNYGPAFRLIRQLWRGGKEALAQISLGGDAADGRYLMHPAMLDAAFQTAAALVPAGGSGSYLPAGIGAWQVLGACGETVWAHVTLDGEPGDATLAVEIELLDDGGAPVGRVAGLRLSRVGTRREKSLAGSLLEIRWEPRPLERESARRRPGRWLILGGNAGLAEELALQLAERGHEAVVARPGEAFERMGPSRYSLRPESPEDMRRLAASIGPLAGAVDLWSLDARPAGASGALEEATVLGCGSALHLAQATIETPPAAGLWLVTRGAQAVRREPLAVEQSALWGLALAIGQEHPDLRGRCVDLDPAHPGDAAAILLDEILLPDGEDRIAWRDGIRYAARLVRSPEAVPLGVHTALPPDRSILITGGFGALGLATARMLASQGARHVVLAGRAGSDGNQQALNELEASGVSVLAVKADVAVAADVARLFQEIALKMPPLAGVIHAAGVLDDGVVAQQSLARLRRAMDPKVLGAWNLHRHTKDLPLDFFIAFSSVASLVGSPGQANYAAGNAFLDALAHHRRALGLPALSVNWGAWGGGMAETAAARRRQEANGVEAIEPSAGLSLLARMFGGGLAPQIGVFPVNWSRFGAQFYRGIPPLLESLIPVAPSPAPAAQAAARGTTRRSWDTVPQTEREPALRTFLRGELAAVLGMPDAARVPTRQGFFEIGMDSLMTVELAHRLESSLGIKLPANLAIDYPNVEALASYLSSRLSAAPPANPPAPPAEDLDTLPTAELARLLACELDAG
jgi:myxalamid-type polyketide synthase MxaE and MxaD